MKGKRTSCFVASVMALAIAGCQETPISPVAADLEPSFSFANGPANPGNSGVIRFESAFGLLSYEESEDGLFAFHFENADLPICGGVGLDPTADFQIVQTPAGVMRDIIKEPDTPISIYRTADALPIITGMVPVEEACQILAEDWLYRGTHTLTIMGLLSEAPTFGWNGHGDVFDPDGNQFRYSERARYLVLDEEPFYVETVYDINVRARDKN